MVYQTYSSKSQQPERKQHTALQKPSDLIRKLLIDAIPKVKRPDPDPNTIDNCINILFTQMLIHGSDIEASSLLKSLINIINSVLETILIQTDPLDTLYKVCAKFKEPSASGILCVSEPTLAAYLDVIPIKTADHALDDQLNGFEGPLKKQGLSPKENALCIDPTDKIYRGKFYNRWTNWGVTGQVATYKRAYKECCIYSNPTGLFVSSAPMLINTKRPSERIPPSWLEQVKLVISNYQDRGITTKLLIGDREFYRGIGMAYAYFGMFTPSLPLFERPRLLSPIKGYENESEGKWAFLMDMNAQQIVKYSMQLDYYLAKSLGDRRQRLILNRKRDHFLIPIAKVAVFDSYSQATTRRSLQWAHIKAHSIASALALAEIGKKKAETEYIAYCTLRDGKPCIAPKYSKKGRKKFKDPAEIPYYLDCRTCHNRVLYWEKQKEKLMRRLIFFGVSLHENEMINNVQAELIDIVEHYHERWGIEICFKGMKWVFNLRTNVRGTKARHVRKIISGMVYNCWHITRLMRWARFNKKSEPRWKPFIIQSIPMAKKYRAELGSKESAHRYILENWMDQIKNSLKKVIMTEI